MNAPEDRLGPDSVFGDVGSISGLPESGRAANNNGWPRSAKSGCEQSQQVALLLDHFVASRKIAASSALLMHRMHRQ
jgi:hypothetical protein